MTYEISESTRAQTKKCRLDFECLKGGECPKCAVEYIILDDGCFVKPAQKENCEYLLSFGYSWICTCPTRCEIFQRYKK